jgi:hypothetical protein
MRARRAGKRHVRPLNASVMRLPGKLISAAVATAVTFAPWLALLAFTGVDDPRGAPLAPFMVALVFLIFWKLSSDHLSKRALSYRRAALVSLYVALLLVGIPAGVWIAFSGDSLWSLGTYAPWLVGILLFWGTLTSGGLSQVWLLKHYEVG